MRFLPALGIILLSALWLSGCQAASATPSPTAPKPAPAVTTAPTATFVAPAATPTSQIQKGGILRVGLRCNPGSMHTFKAQLCPGPLWLIYDQLLGFDEKGNLYPELAEKWDVAPNGKAITFKLRSGSKFHDGTDFNATAVKFNIETLIKEKGVLSARVAEVDSIDVVDNLTVRFNLKYPSAPFLASMAEEPGFMASPTAIEKLGLDELARNPVGSGAFQLEEWVQDSQLTLKRFDRYWDAGKPYLDKLVMPVVTDASVRTINLKTGSIHWSPQIPYKDVASLKASNDFIVHQVYGVGFWSIPLQFTKPPFNNKALRQAVAYSINREAIAKGVFLGFNEPAYLPFPPQSWAYNRDFRGLPYDPAKAKAKLAEGGKPDGLEVTFTTINTEEYVVVAEALQAQLREVGIRAVPKLGVTAATVQTMMAGDFEMGLQQQPGMLDPDLAYGVYHSKGGFNRSRYANPKADELLDKARQTYDPKERKRYYDEAMPIIADDAADVITFYQPIIVASTNKVQNYTLMPGYNHQYEMFKNVWLKR